MEASSADVRAGTGKGRERTRGCMHLILKKALTKTKRTHETYFSSPLHISAPFPLTLLIHVERLRGGPFVSAAAREREGVHDASKQPSRRHEPPARTRRSHAPDAPDALAHVSINSRNPIAVWGADLCEHPHIPASRSERERPRRASRPLLSRVAPAPASSPPPPSSDCVARGADESAVRSVLLLNKSLPLSDWTGERTHFYNKRFTDPFL